MTASLKVCPFCGHDGEIEYESSEVLDRDNWVHIVCGECGGSSGWYLSDEQAVTAWNERSGG